MKKGMFFWLNIAVFFLGVLLIIPLFCYESCNPALFGYSLAYLAYLGIIIIAAGVFLALVLGGGRRFNRNTFFAVMALLLFCELALLFLQKEDPFFRKDINFYPRPYVMFTGKPGIDHTAMDRAGHWTGGQIKIELNDEGFRIERPLPLEKPAGEVRVFVLGGSTVFDGYPLSNSLPGLIEQHFHADGYKAVKVYNLGIVGSVSGQELSLILHTLIDYGPDLIIVYNGGNDITLPFMYDPRPGYPLNFMSYETGLNFTKGEYPLPKILLSVLSRSRAAKLFYRYSRGSLENYLFSTEKIRQAAGYMSEGWEARITERYTENLKKMCRLSKGLDCDIAIFLQPVLYLKSPVVGREHGLFVSRQFQNYTLRQYDRARKGFVDLARTNNTGDKCFFFDISDIFAGYEKEAFIDYIHVDKEGNKFIASRMYELIRRERVLDLPL